MICISNIHNSNRVSFKLNLGNLFFFMYEKVAIVSGEKIFFFFNVNKEVNIKEI